MSNYKKYDEDFKKSLVNLYHGGKTPTSLCKEYGVSFTALSRWVKQYSEVRIENGSILTARQIKELQKERFIKRRKFNSKKSDCYFHATLKQRLDAIHPLRFEHSLVRLCTDLKVNRGTYYKPFSHTLAPRTVENQQIRKHISSIYMEF